MSAPLLDEKVIALGRTLEAEAVPYAVVLVSLDEFPHVRILGNVLNREASEIEIGQKVQAAFEQIEYLLSIPSDLSIPILQLDPRWDPLREHPRYAELLSRHAPKPPQAGP